jgi:hypothetical protein
MRTLLGVLCLVAAALVFLLGCLFLAFSITLTRGGVPEDGSTAVFLLVCIVVCGGLIAGGISLIRRGKRDKTLPPAARQEP